MYEEYYELAGMTDEGYEDLVDLCTFCLITGTPYETARLWPDVLRNAMTEAHNAIVKEQNKTR